MTTHSADDISQLVQIELDKISSPEIVVAIKSLLVTPRLHMRNWDYGKPGETLPCWMILEHHKSSTGIAYSDFGFGPKTPWGLVFLSDSDNWFGMDSGWYTSLEGAFCESVAARDLPAWNLIRQYEDGTKEIVETSLSSDTVIEKMNRLNEGRISTWPFQWPIYRMERPD